MNRFDGLKYRGEEEKKTNSFRWNLEGFQKVSLLTKKSGRLRLFNYTNCLAKGLVCLSRKSRDSFYIK